MDVMEAIIGAITGLVLFGLIASIVLNWLRTARLERALVHVVTGARIIADSCGENSKQIANQGQLMVLVANHVQNLQAKRNEEHVLH